MRTGAFGTLSHALPSEMIFHQLHTIYLDPFIYDYSAEVMLDFLEVIVKWLQVSVRECN